MNYKSTLVLAWTEPHPENWNSMSISERIKSKWTDKAKFSKSFRGHWKPESIKKALKKYGNLFEIKVIYSDKHCDRCNYHTVNEFCLI